MKRLLPFEWVVAFRFMREGLSQTLLIIAGVALGVAVIVFMSALLSGLQSNIIRRTLNSQAPIVVLPPEQVARVLREEGGAVNVQPRSQRLRSIDQWQTIRTQIERLPEVVAVTPVVSGPGFALRGDANKAITLTGIETQTYLVVIALMYPVAVVAGRERLGRFASAILPAQAIAASTQSSLASLPAMLESARTRLGYGVAVPSLVLPMAVSLFRITSPVQYISVATFIAWAYGMPIDVATLAGGVALAVVVSMGSVGLPGQAIFMATNLPGVQAMGLPVAPLGILLALDTIPDVFATVGNVTADLTATSVVARRAPEDAAAVQATP